MGLATFARPFLFLLYDPAFGILLITPQTSGAQTMTPNKEHRFGPDWCDGDISEENKVLCDEINREFSSSLVQPPETKPSNDSDCTYRGRFMVGKESEYDATIEAYKEIYQRESCPHVHALEGCRTYASLRRDSNSGDVMVFGDSCRERWCPMCAGQKAKYAKEQTEIYVKSLNAPRFLTLTLRHNESSLRQQVEFLQQSFSRIRSRAYWKKNVTGGIWFLQVKRGKNSGLWHPHLHILVDGNYMEQGRLSALWELVTFGSPVIDIRRINNAESAAAYVARYTARPAALAEMPLEDRCEVIEALFRKRLCGTFGNGKTVTLTPPKVESDAEWDYIGSYDDIVKKAETSPAAREILIAYNTYQPLTEKAYEDFTGHAPGFVSSFAEPEPKPKQLWLDFFNSA
jgi:hypothetical protein